MYGIFGQLDIGRALLAMVISIALFSVVRGEQNPPEAGSLDVPVDAANPPPGLLVLNERGTTTVQVRISAPRENWVSLRAASLRAYVDLSKASTGSDEYPVTVDVPDPRVRVLEIIPPRIPVRLDESIERPVPVRLNRTGNVPFGYEAGEPIVEPATVTVSGPATVARRVESVSVDLKLDGVTVDVDGRYTAQPADAQGQPILAETRLRLAPPTVRVRVPIQQQLSYKTVGVQPRITGTVRSGFVIEGITTEPAAVTIVGAPPALASVNFAETERIDVTDAAGTFARQLSLIVPEGVSLVRQDLARVTVRVAPVILTQSLTTVPVPEGVTADLQVASILPSVQVIVQGPSSALQVLRPGDLRATVSLAGLSAGSHRVNVEITPPAGMSIESINPRTITVTLADVSAPTPTPTADRPADSIPS